MGEGKIPLNSSSSTSTSSVIEQAEKLANEQIGSSSVNLQEMKEAIHLMAKELSIKEDISSIFFRWAKTEDILTNQFYIRFISKKSYLRWIVYIEDRNRNALYVINNTRKEWAVFKLYRYFNVRSDEENFPHSEIQVRKDLHFKCRISPQGKKEGIFYYYNVETNNIILRGTYCNDVLHGYFFEYFDNGEIHKIYSYANNKLNGLYVELHPKSAYTYKSCSSGTSTCFSICPDKNIQERNRLEIEQSLINRENFGLGKALGMIDFTIRTNIRSKYFYKDDVIEGVYEEYYNNDANSLKIRCMFVNGEKHGAFEEWDENGEMAAYHPYIKDKKHGEVFEWAEASNNGEVPLFVQNSDIVVVIPKFPKVGNLQEHPSIIIDNEKTDTEMPLIDKSLLKKKKYKFKLTYVNGVLEGDFIGWFPNGNVYFKATCVAGKTNGLFKEYYNNSYNHLRYIINFKDNNMDGIFRELYNIDEYSISELHDLQVAKLENLQGVKASDLKGLCDKEGFVSLPLKTEISFVNNVMNGKYIHWYKNGYVKLHTYITNGEIDGTYIIYHMNGLASVRYKYNKGKLDGDCEEYHKNGYLFKRYTYINGILHDLSVDGGNYCSGCKSCVNSDTQLGGGSESDSENSSTSTKIKVEADVDYAAMFDEILPKTSEDN